MVRRIGLGSKEISTGRERMARHGTSSAIAQTVRQGPLNVACSGSLMAAKPPASSIQRLPRAICSW